MSLAGTTGLVCVRAADLSPAAVIPYSAEACFPGDAQPISRTPFLISLSFTAVNQ